MPGLVGTPSRALMGRGGALPQLLDRLEGLRRVVLRVLEVLQDLADDALLVDDKGGAAVAYAFFVEDAERLGAVESGEIRDNGVGETAVVREGLLRWSGIGAAAQDLGIELFEVRDQALELPQLSLSATGEGTGVERQDDVLLALETGDREVLLIRRPEGNIRGLCS